jgi:hypothetical protein
MKKKPPLVSPFFIAFPYDRIPKAMRDVNVYFLIHSSNSGTLYKQISVNYIR